MQIDLHSLYSIIGILLEIMSLLECIKRHLFAEQVKILLWTSFCTQFYPLFVGLRNNEQSMFFLKNQSIFMKSKSVWWYSRIDNIICIINWK